MRKIITEQVGNTVSILLLCASMAHMATASRQFELGLWFALLVGWQLLFVGYRRWLSKHDAGYHADQGEFSSADEREAHVSIRAAVLSYRVVMIATMSLIVIAAFVVMRWRLPAAFLAVLFIWLLGGLVILGLQTYLAAWIHYDRLDAD